MSRTLVVVGNLALSIHFIYSLIYSSQLKYTLDPVNIPKEFKILSKNGPFFLTVWNFILQIIFLFVVIIDELCNVVKDVVSVPKIQHKIQRIRQYMFLSLIFPCSLIVMTIFWGLYAVDRELIFPKIIDTFYPKWLNHTMHTIIAVPLVLELVFQRSKRNYRVSRSFALATLTIFLALYQTLNLSIYLVQNVWLYPIYQTLDWTGRLIFILLVFGLAVGFQQTGFALLNNEKSKGRNKKN
ncbi:androgen-dependent TFPI-regulating protein-like [Sitophilus oryzae]|uniref:Androgen-dependent TFPI-regulating protein-like n=1 Tax=Sitophilus oryzae TaxID=7048 RepID=A0A6J2X9X2_SITOR|nr:androgen-dependent TFPI-regulating protein-like [Sitophilus oryzae]